MTILSQNIQKKFQIYDEGKAELFLEDLKKKIESQDCPIIEKSVFSDTASDDVRNLIQCIFSCSPYLSQIILRFPNILDFCLSHDPSESLEHFIQELKSDVSSSSSMVDVMSALRVFKRNSALLCALCDLAGIWGPMETTHALTRVADTSLDCCLQHLFSVAASKGDYLPRDVLNPVQGCGYFVLGMGKYGAFELNYSSDIDLIVLYDREQIKLKDGLDPSTFFVNLTKTLVKLMQERTAEGYVFRTDLRLRPDPGSTQVAISTDAALVYYESMGQNWERAAYIKARAVAGDIQSGQNFLEQLSPFVWRRYLDYAAIAEVHSMKRQIHAYKGHGEIAVAGHNIKLGRGGIREIEFFAQTQQLIAGGRQVELRTAPTLETLDTLVEKQWVEVETANDLKDSYLFLRHLEHRIQMVADEQTHTLPKGDNDLKRIALFAGFESYGAFSQTLKTHLETVQGHYAKLFEVKPQREERQYPLNFETPQDKTVDELTRMGFEDVQKVLTTVQKWHDGKYPALRRTATRQRLTEFQNVLLEALGRTASPDQALISFDRFLSNLPSGIQLFSMLKNNPNLLRLVADIMGTAPRLSNFLSRHSRVFDVVLDPEFFGPLPSDDVLKSLIDEMMDKARDYQDILDWTRSIGQEQAFLIGVRLLSGSISAEDAGYAYGTLAVQLIEALHKAVCYELSLVHGDVEKGRSAVLAMGKLGGLEMTASSDLDLILIYDFDTQCTQSNGEKALAPQQYYTRTTQRLISSLTSPTSYGSLYEVDLRLRPSGQSGPLATRLDSFISYQNTNAWTWEHMALTRARVISGSETLALELSDIIRDVLCMPREPKKIATDVLEMRRRLTKDRPTKSIWNIKLIQGGLMDLEFITQYLQLIHANKHPDILDQHTLFALQKMSKVNIIDEKTSEILIQAAELYNRLTQILRLCVTGQFEPETAPQGLKDLLARTNDEPGFVQLETRLQETVGLVRGVFEEVIGGY